MSCLISGGQQPNSASASWGFPGGGNPLPPKLPAGTTESIEETAIRGAKKLQYSALSQQRKPRHAEIAEEKVNAFPVMVPGAPYDSA